MSGTAPAVFQQDRLLSLPVELLYIIVAEVVAEDIDRIVTGGDEAPFGFEDHYTRRRSLPRFESYSVALLVVSRRSRQITSQVFEWALGAKFDRQGWLSNKPWAFVKVMAQLYGAAADTSPRDLITHYSNKSALLNAYRRLMILFGISFATFQRDAVDAAYFRRVDKILSRGAHGVPQEALGWRVGRHIRAMTDVISKIRILWSLGVEVAASQAKVDSQQSGTPEHQAEMKILSGLMEGIWTQTSQNTYTWVTIKYSRLLHVVQCVAQKDIPWLLVLPTHEPIATAILERWSVKFPTLGLPHLLLPRTSRTPEAGDTPKLDVQAKARLAATLSRLLRLNIKVLTEVIEKRDASEDYVLSWMLLDDNCAMLAEVFPFVDNGATPLDTEH